jgi:hypothetical protein
VDWNTDLKCRGSLTLLVHENIIELLKMGILEVFKKTCSAGPFLR